VNLVIKWKRGTSCSGVPSVCVFVFNSVTLPPQHRKLQQAFGDDAMLRAQVSLALCFLEAEPLLKIDDNTTRVRQLIRSQWRTEGGGFPPPRNSEVLPKLSRIPSSVEYTSVTT
jgi:hypothetical protein